MNDVTEKTKLDLLKEQAKELGITFHPSVGEVKLQAKIDEKLIDLATAGESPDPVEEPKVVKESRSARNNRLRKEARSLKRVIVVCMNPNKQQYENEVFTVGNAVTGTISRVVPFNNSEGWHIEKFIYDVLKAKQCQIFVDKDLGGGKKKRVGKMIPEYVITDLPALNQSDLDELATRQALNKSID